MTDASAFEYARYPVGYGNEWMMVRGPREGPRVLILAPILNEANGCRALVVDLARHLAIAGVGSAIPDLPGTGESTRSLAEVRWADWRDAVAAAGAVLGPTAMVASLRGGTLLDDACAASSRWRFAEATGAALLRPLERAQRLGNPAREDSSDATVTLAGFHLHGELVDSLRAAVPVAVAGPLRSMAFDGTGVPIWRRAEPTHDPELAKRMADDLLAWMSTCAR